MFFAECLRHSAKARLHSAKSLPSAALGKEHTVKNLSAKHSLPSVFYRALDKGFAECPGDTRQRKATGTEAVRWQSLCRVPTLQALGKDFFNFFNNFFAECQPVRHSAKIFYFFKKISLPSALWMSLGKVLFFFKKILCRVPTREALGKDFLFFFKFSLPSANA